LAIYHFSASMIKRSNGRSSTAAAAYRAGEKLHDERQGITHDYTRKSGVHKSFIMTPEHCEKQFSREELWNNVEAAEQRKDAQVAREIDIALPVELSHEMKEKLVANFVQKELVSKGMIADVAFHDFESHNPHCHIMLTTREVSKDGEFGKKERSWNDKNLLKDQRLKWELYANKALEIEGQKARIDHRSHEDRKLETVPQIHLGPKANQAKKENPDTKHPRVESWRGIEQLNAKIIELGKTQREIENLKAQRNIRSLIEEPTQKDLKAPYSIAVQDWGKNNYQPFLELKEKREQLEKQAKQVRAGIQKLESSHKDKTWWQRFKTRKEHKSELGRMNSELMEIGNDTRSAFQQEKAMFKGLPENPDAHKGYEIAQGIQRQERAAKAAEKAAQEARERELALERALEHERLKNTPREPQSQPKRSFEPRMR